MNSPSAAPRTAHATEKSRWPLVGGSIAVALFIGWTDYITGWEWSFFVFYAVPIFVLAWYRSQGAGVAMALACAVIWWMANETASPYKTKWGFGMAAATRLAYFIFVGIGAAALRAREEINAARIAALERTRSLESDLVRISEHEQRRIGQDLHDGVCQSLAAIACAVRTLREDLSSGRQPAPSEAEQIEDMLRDTTLEARQLARRFFPAHMDGAGLGAALQELVAASARNSTAALVFDESESESGPGDPEVAVHLFRITQEALNNAMKHSGATRIAVSLESRPGRATVKVVDNGAGASAISESRSGLGLKTMSYRARLIGSSLQITPSPGGGTTVCCTWEDREPPTPNPTPPTPS